MTGTPLVTTADWHTETAVVKAAGRAPDDAVSSAKPFDPPAVTCVPVTEAVAGALLLQLTVSLGRAVPVTLRTTPGRVRDSPGFASSRLGVVLGLEAMRMVEDGVASAADIDRAMELGYNHPMGPLKLTDLVGLDVRLKIAEYLHQTLGGAQYEPPAILRRLVAEGKLGKKTGEGFYNW